MAKDRTRAALDKINAEAVSKKKLELAAAWLKSEGLARIESGAYGEVVIRCKWENGELKEIKLVEETIVRDLAPLGIEVETVK